MSRNNLSEWARRLEDSLSAGTENPEGRQANQDSDVELDLAASAASQPFSYTGRLA